MTEQKIQKTENTSVKWTDPKTGKVRYKSDMPLRELKKLVSEEVFEAERTRRRNKKKQYMKQYRQENKDKIAEYKKQYSQENRDKLAEQMKQYYQENRDKRLEYKKQYRQENRDKLAEYNKQYRQENRDKLAEQMKQYRQENKDKIIELSKQYYQENKDKIAEYQKQYRQENPEIIRQKNHRRRANLNNCLPTDSAFLKQFNQSKQQCPITGSNTVDLEHVYPVSKGWLGNNKGNLMWLQSNLNSSKGNKNVFTWLTELTQSDIDFLLREEDAVPTIEQFRQKYYEVLEEQATLLGMTFEEYRTEYNNRFQETQELTEATV